MKARFAAVLAASTFLSVGGSAMAAPTASHHHGYRHHQHHRHAYRGPHGVHAHPPLHGTGGARVTG